MLLLLVALVFLLAWSSSSRLAPQAQAAYTEKASRSEMRFAGQFLHLAGVGLVVAGLLLLLKDTHSGWVPSLLGLAVGAALTGLGDRSYRAGLRGYGEPMVAGGAAVLLLTACASHYFFRLLPTPGFLLSVAALVGWSGLAALRYNSPAIGLGVLAALFGAPLAMALPLHTPGTMAAYLLAISAGTVALAAVKRWDIYLIAALWASYALFWPRFWFEQPMATLLFMAATYLLFLLASSLRRDETPSSLILTMANPVAFALLSYVELSRLPAGLAVGLYAALALIHWSLKRRDHAILSFLFLNAAISFVPYFRTDTSLFALTTLLWLAEALVLGRRFPNASLAALGLSTAQLLYVVPSIPDARLVLVLSAGSLAGMGIYTYRLMRADRWQGHPAAAITLVSAGWLLIQSSLASVVLGSSALAALLIALSVRQPSLGWMRTLGQMLALITGIATWALPAEPVSCLVGALLLATSGYLSRDVDTQSVADLSAWVVLARAVAFLGALWAAPAVLVLWVVYAGRTELRGLLALVTAVAMVWTTGWSLVAPAWQVLAMAACWVGTWLVARRAAVPLAATMTVVPLFMVLKASLSLGLGAVSTVIWCLTALALSAFPEHRAQVRAVFFLALLKSVITDGTLRIGGKGLELVPPGALDLGQMLAALAVVGSFFFMARRLWSEVELRNEYLLMGMLAACFAQASVLHNYLGVLLVFQVLLSAFWCASAFAVIAFGIHRQLKVFRLFGLAILGACSLKILFVDQWVLSSYSRVGACVILGLLLMAVAYLYQFNREKLEDSPNLCTA